ATMQDDPMSHRSSLRRSRGTGVSGEPNLCETGFSQLLVTATTGTSHSDTWASPSLPEADAAAPGRDRVAAGSGSLWRIRRLAHTTFAPGRDRVAPAKDNEAGPFWRTLTPSIPARHGRDRRPLVVPFRAD